MREGFSMPCLITCWYIHITCVYHHSSYARIPMATKANSSNFRKNGGFCANSSTYFIPSARHTSMEQYPSTLIPLKMGMNISRSQWVWSEQKGLLGLLPWVLRPNAAKDPPIGRGFWWNDLFDLCRWSRLSWASHPIAAPNRNPALVYRTSRWTNLLKLGFLWGCLIEEGRLA